MSVEVNNESAIEAQLEQISALGRHILAELNVHPETDVSIILLDEEPMSTLHVQWMDLPGPTDVVICPQVATTQANTGGHSVQDEILLLATHGMLHLLGFDHAEPEEKELMFALQRQLLEAFLGRPAPRETMD